MNQIGDFFFKLFDTSDWPPRWVCGTWTEFHGWLYIVSDLTIWLAYFLIPVIIIWFIQKKPDIPFLPVFWLFGAFILFCGATHLLDALIFWWPGYRLSALIRFGTAVVSMITVFALIRDLPKLLNIATPGSTDTTKNNTNLQEVIDKRDKEIERLNAEILRLRSES